MTTLTHLVSKKAIEQDNIQRYPGPRSFDDKEIDEHLFYGRNKEIDTLINRIQARRTLVLFGLSGVGKTSLIQAGLYPKLRRLGYLPIPIRLNDPNVNLLQSIEYRVKQLNAQNKVDVEIGKYPSVWHLFKQTVFLKNEQLLIPILVFDQFEEVFTLQNTSYRTSLTEELKNLIGRTIPSSVRKDIEDDKHLDYTPEPPEMRLLFILRQEYVGSLETFITKIPTFLEYRFQLKPLKKRASNTCHY